MSDYPEHDKLRAVQDQSQAIGDFLEFVAERYHCELGRPQGSRAEFTPVNLSVTKLLAEYFEIDLHKLEQEKRALLEHQRRLNDERQTP